MRRNNNRNYSHSETTAESRREDEVDGLKGTTARNALENNNSFAFFVDRMHAVNRAFLVKKKGESEVEVVAFPEPVDGDETRELHMTRFEAESKWLDCCLREFVERRSRYGSRRRLAVRIVGVLALVIVFLWWFWPLWEVLIDLEAETHLKVLGVPPGAEMQEIKRAYREAVKRWHPDRNPNCESCRAQMVKIQHAHDVLLARGSQRFVLADKYREELVQLRSLVFFRLYNMAFNAAQEIYYLTRGSLMIGRDRDGVDVSWPLQTACRVLTMGLFTLYEVLYISGFSIVVLLQVFYYCVSAAKSSAQELEIASMVKHSYIDLRREAVLFAGIPLLMHVILWYFDSGKFAERDTLEFLFQMTFGLLYILAHLYRMTPNILDNINMKKCSIPLKYLRLPSRSVSLQSFVFTELGIVLDDLFAFTCKVPSVYRLAVIFVHVVFLCELAFLPWDPPVVGKLNQRHEKKSFKPQKEKKRTVEKTLENKIEEFPHQPLSPDELALLKNLDSELINWLDVVSTKYKKRMDTAATTYMRQQRGAVSFDLAPTANLQEVNFVGTVQNSSGVPGRIDVLFRVKDEASSRLLGLQRGPVGCTPSELSENKNPDAIARRFALVSGKDGSYTPSELWQSKLVFTKLRTDNNVWMVIMVMVMFVLCWVLLIVSPSPKDQMKHLVDVSSFQQPLREPRWPFLPNEHTIRQKGAGLITLLGRVFCCVDIWDGLRHTQHPH
ncbi:hypothetical protein DQ04_02591050 [Trypanosoma grayi]|uniref:hypothetical protein n=1 Tax=Trypanosoma grayi TaxID=71804 RepID=UPI0004F49663|nr:hypothetical protein DQ04_02591050 [Trypanosoma grayi]KEG11467.1 hypothetical protein DQ04_02591050 [Trypanosoma grayi]